MDSVIERDEVKEPLSGRTKSLLDLGPDAEKYIRDRPALSICLQGEMLTSIGFSAEDSFRIECRRPGEIVILFDNDDFLPECRGGEVSIVKSQKRKEKEQEGE
jgi:hypothetical protein